MVASYTTTTTTTATNTTSNTFTTSYESHSYIPPPGFDRFGVKIDNTPATMQAKKSSRKVLDPNMPKRVRYITMLY